jgi:beta-galactosidase/beta-glucuronidase
MYNRAIVRVFALFLCFMAAGRTSPGSVKLSLSSSTPDVWTIEGNADPRTPISVPHVMNRNGVGYDTTFGSTTFTYERAFDVPPGIEGLPRKYVRFERSNWRTTVYVNDMKVGVHDGGFHAFEIEITGAIKPRENLLRVVVEDYHCIMNREKRSEKGTETLLGLVGLEGGWNHLRGIHDHVYLVGRNDVSLEEFYVWGTLRGKTSPAVRDDSSIHARTSLVNRSRADASAKILYRFEADHDIEHVLSSGPLHIPAGHSVSFDMHDVWSGARLWWPHDPFLYKVTASVVVDEQVVDSETFDFGFRDFYARNTEAEPYVDDTGNVVGDLWLNGVRIRLRVDSFLLDATSVLTELIWDEKSVDSLLENVKGHNFNAVRLHGGTFPKSFCRAADRIGLMVIHEMPFHGSRNLGEESVTYDYVNPVFWKTAGRQIAEIVRDTRQFASVVLWSAATDVHVNASPMLQQYPPFLKNLATLYNVIRANDPSREIMFDGERDLLFPFANKLFVHSTHRMNVDADATGPPRSNRRPFVLHRGSENNVSYQQTMEYRTFRNWDVFGFVGSGSARPDMNVMKQAFRPYVAYCLNNDDSFFEEQSVRREFAVMNDSLHGGKFSLRVTVRDTAGWSVFSKDIPVPDLEPGEVRRLEVRFTAPIVGDSDRFTLEYDLWRDNEPVDENRHVYSVVQRSAVSGQ